MPEEYIPSLDGNLTYLDKDTFIQRWDPRTKIVTCISLVFLISAVKNPKNIVLICLFLLGIVLFMGLEFKDLIKRTSLLFPFLIFMGIPILFGQGIPISNERKEIVILLAFKSLSSLYLMFIMFFTQPMWEFLGALSFLKIPNSVMSIIFLSWRYVFILGNRLRDMFKGLYSRGFKLKFSKATFNVMGQIVGGMLIKSIDTSDTVYNAMLLRGFDNKIPVSRPRDIGLMDLLKSSISIILLILVLIIERW